MTRPHISQYHTRGSIRAGDTFPRREPPEFQRVPWQSRPPLLPYGINWAAVLDAAIVAAVLLLALCVAVGALP